MPKYWGGGREEERLNDGDNNGQATNGARKPPGPKISTLNGFDKHGIGQTSLENYI